MSEARSPATDEKIAHCRARLRLLDEFEAQVRQAPWTAEGDDAVRDATKVRRELLRTLQRLERPTLWQRITQRTG